jgi:hypothetical protein
VCSRRTGFRAVSSLQPVSPGRFAANIHPDWTIGGKPNGGYLLAILGRAAQSMGPHQDVIAASAHYLHAPVAGPVSVDAERLRTGRGVSQARARLLQGGRICVEALITTSQLLPGGEAHWDRGLPSVTPTPYADCVRLAPRTPDGSPVAILDQVDVRLDPASAGFTRGQPAGRGELSGWVTLPGEDFDPAGLLYAVDALPPATFDIEFTGWVPTLELTAYVRAIPAPGPVRVLQRAQVIDGQRVDEVCFVWDVTGRLVAEGVQLAGIRLG